LTTVPLRATNVPFRRLRQSGQRPARILDKKLLATLPASVQAAASRAAKAGYRLFIKDVLHVSPPEGWQCDAGDGRYEAWHVDQSEIARLAQQYHRYYRAAGNSPVNLTWDHSDSARDVCGDVFDQWPSKDGKVLYALIGTRSEQAFRALNEGMPVSVQANPNHRDGAGNRYPVLVTHVALCQRPVVTNQQPAQLLLSQRGKPSGSSPMSMQNWIRKLFRQELASAGVQLPVRRLSTAPRRVKRLADNPASTDDEPPEEPEEPEANDYGVDPDATEVPIKAMVEVLNDCCGHDLSDRITTFNEMLIALEGQTPEAEPDDDDDAGSLPMAGGGDTGPSTPGAMTYSQTSRSGRRLANIEQENAELRAALAQRDAEAQERTAKARRQRKLSFTKAVDDLLKEGRLPPAERQSVLRLGKTTGWNQEVLRPYRLAAPQVPSKRRAGANASKTPLGTNGAPEEPELTDEQRKQLQRKFKLGQVAGKGSCLRT
jgi:hypothetical protein